MDFGQTYPLPNRFGIRADAHWLRISEGLEERSGCGGYNSWRNVLLSAGPLVGLRKNSRRQSLRPPWARRGAGYPLREWINWMTTVYFVGNGGFTKQYARTKCDPSDLFKRLFVDSFEFLKGFTICAFPSEQSICRSSMYNRCSRTGTAKLGIIGEPQMISLLDQSTFLYQSSA